MTDNILPFRQKPPPEPKTNKYTFTVRVNGADYTVVKVCSAETGHGFGKILDDNGKLLLIYPTSLIPDAVVAQIIIVWRGGFSAGFYEGSCVAAKLKERMQ